jgi:hypothetical protein
MNKVHPQMFSFHPLYIHNVIKNTQEHSLKYFEIFQASLRYYQIF